VFNARLFTADGTFIASADAWWPESGVAAEVDSREWHLSPADWERTMRRHATMSSHGILVLHFTPRQIRSESATVIAAVADTLQTGRARPTLPITARQAA
jgi:very-short-patch-repair endonuclease